MDARRRKILERLDAVEVGRTEDDRKTERRATIRRAIEAEEDLKWGRLSAGNVGGIAGRSVLPFSGMRAETQSARHAGPGSPCRDPGSLFSGYQPFFLTQLPSSSFSYFCSTALQATLWAGSSSPYWSSAELKASL